MLSWLNKLAWIVIVSLILGGVSYYLYRYTENDRRIHQLEQETTHLKQMVQRLTASRRVAELMLTGRRTDAGQPITKMLFVEYARDQESAVNVREFELTGNEVHVDAKVIRFDRDFVLENDPLRGCSIALFTRIFGDKQAPAQGPLIDAPGVAPEIYKGANPASADFEARLWKDFWRLLEDPVYAKSHGVRVAQGEGVWWPPQEGKLYTLSINADGGLELNSEPIKPIYLQAMKKLTR